MAGDNQAGTVTASDASLSLRIVPVTVTVTVTACQCRTSSAQARMPVVKKSGPLAGIMVQLGIRARPESARLTRNRSPIQLHWHRRAVTVTEFDLEFEATRISHWQARPSRSEPEPLSGLSEAGRHANRQPASALYRPSPPPAIRSPIQPDPGRLRGPGLETQAARREPDSPADSGA